MATKQVKQSVRTYASVAAEDTKLSNRMRSPSPARISRLQEKDALTSLNDRLATYIDHIRSLENENSKLHLQVQTYEETSQREISTIKCLYENELVAARRLVDDLAKENAKLTVNVGSLKTENEEWVRKCTLRDRELTALQTRLCDVEAKLTELQSQLSVAYKERDRAQDECSRIRGDFGDLENQLSLAKKQLEEATLRKIDLENEVHTLKEELSFKGQLHQTELNETRARLEFSLEEVDQTARSEYENRLQEALADLRQQQEAQQAALREELNVLYEAKLTQLQSERQSMDSADERVRVEVAMYKSRISELQSQITKLANQNATLEARVASLEADLVAEREQASAQAEYREKEIRILRERMDAHMHEYQDLLDIKVSLDLEISAYRKLLESEEERLKLSQSESCKTPPRKRRREEQPAFVEETRASSAFTAAGNVLGCIEISEISEDGKFIRVKNNSDQEVLVGSWLLEHKSGSDTTQFKFHRSAKVNGGDVLTVWSADAGVDHDPAKHNLVMKGQKWLVSDNMSTTLYDKEGKEQASIQMKRSQQRTVQVAARQVTTAAATAKTEVKSNKCSIM